MRRIDEIILHCTATPAGKDVSIEHIRKWHIARGFDDIGYHYIIDINGKVHVGRTLDKVGAHTLGHNKHSIGIAYVGGLHSNGTACCTLTYQQHVALLELIESLSTLYPNISKISGHNDYSNKACPCFDVTYYNKFLYERRCFYESKICKSF